MVETWSKWVFTVLWNLGIYIERQVYFKKTHPEIGRKKVFFWGGWDGRLQNSSRPVSWKKWAKTLERSFQSHFVAFHLKIRFYKNMKCSPWTDCYKRLSWHHRKMLSSFSPRSDPWNQSTESSRPESDPLSPGGFWPFFLPWVGNTVCLKWLFYLLKLLLVYAENLQ